MQGQSTYCLQPIREFIRFDATYYDSLVQHVPANISSADALASRLQQWAGDVHGFAGLMLLTTLSTEHDVTDAHNPLYVAALLPFFRHLFRG